MRTITIPEQTTFENIKQYEHFIGKKVSVQVGTGTVVDGEFVYTVPQQYDSIDIIDIPAHKDTETEADIPEVTDYTDLMSANPPWHPEKPAGTFSQDDLWHFIDLIRARRTNGTK